MASKASRSAKAPKPLKEQSLTKAQVVAELATRVDMSKVQVNEIFDKLFDIIGEELSAGHSITIPGLVKLVLVRKAATSARPGRNPFTGESITLKAKPARNVVRAKPLKALKDLA